MERATARSREVEGVVTRTAGMREDQMEAGRPPVEAVKSSKANIDTVETIQTRTQQKNQQQSPQKEDCMLQAHTHIIMSMCMHCPLRRARKSIVLKRACVHCAVASWQPLLTSHQGGQKRDHDDCADATGLDE